MDIRYHGARCCGIKTIEGFNKPGDTEDERGELPITCSDACGDHVSSKESFFHESAPEETQLERLDRFISYLKRRRPSHIIEAVLAENERPDRPSFALKQNSTWGTILKKRGFRLVTSAKNSNSGNTIYVYHLVIEDGEVVRGGKKNA